jgi:broad specificity phosphatase PhoE
LAVIYLVRHGTTDWVDLHRLHGITDVPLNAVGLRQSEQAAAALKDFKVEAVYSSPLERCMQTAECLGRSLGVVPVPLEGLCERDFGLLEGRILRDHTAQDFSKLVQEFDNLIHRLASLVSGESQRHFQARVLSAWLGILQEHMQGNVVVVGHSAVFNTILIHHFGRNFPNGKPYYTLQPGSITEIEIAPAGEAHLIRLDDHRHIRRGP